MKYIFLFLLIFSSQLFAECSDLDETECSNWPDYCSWNEDVGVCQETGGGGNLDYGPYEFSYLTESDGIRNSPDYMNGILYYPTEAAPPYRSIIFTPGWGGESTSMTGWAEYFASYGFIAMAIGPNDVENDTHQMRAEGLIDAIETIKQEDERTNSPLFGIVDPDRFIVAGYSMGGGASQVALVLDHPFVEESIVGAIALNPTVIFEDCDLCPGSEYCICLVPEFLQHNKPTLIVAGQYELQELPDYDGLLGQDIYENTPETNVKILYEIENAGHSAAEASAGQVHEKMLHWMNYLLLEDNSYCDSLMLSPDNASLYLTTLECEINFNFDLNNDNLVNQLDIFIVVNMILTGSTNIIDPNYDDVTDIFDVLYFVDYINNI